MDDPLSALDAHVKKAIFENVFLEAMRGKTRVMVTHALDCIPKCDRIISLKEG
jgi:ABC-type bacteriocin/lantibiotic exporter with double-glycine peptidase domain